MDAIPEKPIFHVILSDRDEWAVEVWPDGNLERINTHKNLLLGRKLGSQSIRSMVTFFTGPEGYQRTEAAAFNRVTAKPLPSTDSERHRRGAGQAALTAIDGQTDELIGRLATAYWILRVDSHGIRC
jgi:hypothetical protein